MLINNWYVACDSARLAAEPLALRMLDQPVVLYRDSGGVAHCLADTCVHRGGSLGRGKCINDALRCPYHGWRFDGSGRCVEIPSLPAGGKIPARARIDAYPVREQWGWVWVFLGDLDEAERPDLPGESFFPEWYAHERGDTKYRFIRGSFVFAANYKRAIENVLDPSHPNFVHSEFGPASDCVVRPFEVVTDAEQTWATHDFTAAQKSGSWKEADMGGDAANRVALYWSGMIFRNDVRPRPDWHHIVMSGYLPLDEHHTLSTWIHARTFLHGEKEDAVAASRVTQVFQEDADVIDYVAPGESPDGSSQELLLESDKHLSAFRREMARREALGWRIDSQRVALERQRKIFAIPSPARRAHKGWVHETVPLVANQPPAEQGA